jgi:hypothetical protein
MYVQWTESFIFTDEKYAHSANEMLINIMGVSELRVEAG